MNANDINAETPVRAVLEAEGNRRALMTRLAMLVFGKSDGKVIRAYTQFSPQSLASLIEARRKGIFDYGETIRKLEVGSWTYPSNTDAVLRTLDLAAEGEYDEIDLGALGVLDSEGRPLVDIARLVPSMQKPRLGGSAKKVEEEEEEEEEEEVEGSTETETQEAREVKAEVQATLEAETKRRQEVASAIQSKRFEELSPVRATMDPTSVLQLVVEPIQEHIARLSTNLGETLEGMHKQTFEGIEGLRKELNQKSTKLDLVLEQHAVLSYNLGILARALETLDRNLQQVSLYFVDPEMEFEPLQIELVEASIEQRIERPSNIREGEEEADVGDEEPSYEADDFDRKVPEVWEFTSNKTSGESTVERYTKQELENMELQDLRAYAESIGVTPARWQKTNVNRILAEYERLDSER